MLVWAELAGCVVLWATSMLGRTEAEGIGVSWGSLVEGACDGTRLTRMIEGRRVGRLGCCCRQSAEKSVQQSSKRSHCASHEHANIVDSPHLPLQLPVSMLEVAITVCVGNRVFDTERNACGVVEADKFEAGPVVTGIPVGPSVSCDGARKGEEDGATPISVVGSDGAEDPAEGTIGDWDGVVDDVGTTVVINTVEPAERRFEGGIALGSCEGTLAESALAVGGIDSFGGRSMVIGDVASVVCVWFAKTGGADVATDEAGSVVAGIRVGWT